MSKQGYKFFNYCALKTIKNIQLRGNMHNEDLHFDERLKALRQYIKMNKKNQSTV